MTKSSTPTLSEAARHLVYPPTIKTTLWPRIKRRLALMEVTYDQWQVGIARLTLGCTASGKYAAMVGGVCWSIPRQVGKTFTAATLIIALCIEFPGLKVLWTAHHNKTSTDAFGTFQGIVKRKRVAPHLAATRTDGIKAGHADQVITFANGSSISFGARESGFGRGFTVVDVIVFDEAQILGEKALDDMVPSAMRSKHKHGALLFYMGTPPRPTDKSEAFANKRAKALSGKTQNMIYVEFSADPDSDPDDESQWPVMNPSYPTRTPREAMLMLRENLPSDESWNREGRGIWDPARAAGVIPAVSWVGQADSGATAVADLALGVEAGPDLAWAAISLAGRRADGSWLIELVEDQHTKGRGTAWLVPAVEEWLGANPEIRAVVVDVGGPLAALVEQRANKRWYFKDSQVEVTPMRVAELGQGCTLLLDGIVRGWLWHIDQPQLSTAALSAGKRPLGDTGLWVWSRKAAESDITPIQAATYALIGAQADRPRKPLRSSGRVSSERRAIVL